VLPLFTCSEGSTRPSATKRGYIISHSDLSKSAMESESPQGAGISKAHSTSTFAFLDLFCGAPFGAIFCHRVFFIEVNYEQSSRMDESLTQDFHPSHGASTAGTWELEASLLSAMYTLVAISLASGQSSNESPSEPCGGTKPENHERDSQTMNLIMPQYD
jgi:hypothetical protein